MCLVIQIYHILKLNFNSECLWTMNSFYYPKFFSLQEVNDEFSHTVLHGQKIRKALPPGVQRPQPVRPIGEYMYFTLSYPHSVSCVLKICAVCVLAKVIMI